MKKKQYIVVVFIFLIIIILLCGVFFWLYPIKYKKYIIKSANKYNLSKSLVSAIICVESRFNPKAKSAAGASGLMQIMPSTFKWICNELDYNENQIFVPEVNIDSGCFYIRYLLNKYNNLIYVLACYNAGERVVAGWGISDDFDKTKIKYEETLNYVNKVLALEKFYASRFD